LGATGRIVYLALAEQVVEKLAGFLLVFLNLIRLGITFTLGIV
jgi:hypothetical protein